MPSGNLENEASEPADPGARLRAFRKRLHVSLGRRAYVARWVADADKGSEEFRLTPAGGGHAGESAETSWQARTPEGHPLGTSQSLPGGQEGSMI